MCIQIHLMLLLIDTLRHVRQRVGIQIHLMLLLIMCGLRRIGATKKDSNTSHVTINQGYGGTMGRKSSIQIHLMLLLIGGLWREREYGEIFKYISCYY